MIADYPGIFGQFVVQLTGTSPRITEEKFNFIAGYVTVSDEDLQAFEIAAPVDAVSQSNTAMQFVVALVYKMDTVLRHRYTQKQGEIGIGKFAHDIAELNGCGLVEHVAHGAILAIVLAQQDNLTFEIRIEHERL